MASVVPEEAEGAARRQGGWAAWLDRVDRRAVPAALLFGALAALALPPLHLLPGLLGFAGWLRLLMAAPSRRRALVLGWWFGFGYFLIGLYWIAIAFFTDAEKFGALAVPAVLLLCAVAAVFPALAGLALGVVRPRHPVAAALALAIAWTVAEWLRAHFLWGFPWNLIGYVWIEINQVSQLAAWIGIYGLSLVTVLAGALCVTPAYLAGRARWSGPVAAMALLALVFVAGAVRLSGAEPGMQPDIRLRLVQANVTQHHKWDPDLRAEGFRRHLALSAGPPAEATPPDSGGDGRITHIVWPESASPYLLDRDAAAREMMAEVVPAGGLLLAGTNRFDLDSDPPRAWNSVAVLDARGAILASYDKHRLVPFGEFLPWRGLLARIGLRKITDGTVDFVPGPGTETLKLEGLPPFSPLVCYEAIFTGEVADPDDRPAWLLNLTNDAWFGRSSGPYQHFAMARMRAIEEGLPLVRSANTGISAVVDPYGRVQAELGLGAAGVLDAPLPEALDPTFYARWRQAGFLLMVAVGSLMIFMIEKVLKNRYVKFR